jgi:hypothetical protein
MRCAWPLGTAGSPTAVLHVYTFKEGMLSRLAHDLRLSVPRFAVSLEGGRILASFDPTSAQVDGTMARGALQAGTLSAADRKSILRTVTTEVLGAGVVRFEGTLEPGAPVHAVGRLTLPPRPDGARELRVPVRVESQGLVVELDLVPSQLGIPPYRALGGAIRLADRWHVRLALPWTGGELREGIHRWGEFRSVA